MNLEACKTSQKDLLAALAVRERDPFPVFVRAWVLTVLPLVTSLVLLAYHPRSMIVWLLVAVVAGFTQNALGVLMHEASHFFFHRNKHASDVLADFLVCLPICNTVRGYRVAHFEHHRRSGEADDPYFELYGDYPTRRHLARAFLLDLSGVSALEKFFWRYAGERVHAGEQKQWHALSGLALVQFVLWALFYQITGLWFAYLLLWIMPLMTIPFVVNRLRTMVEHYPGFCGIQINRTSITGLIEYLCIAPYGYGNHLEHHLMPQIPYYELDFAHRFLDERVCFTENEVNAHGYLRTFHRLVLELAAMEKQS